ncbi:hypothetical protein PCC7418_1205 [Halothece sp. PCC 7418]|nr:hypothetical protein PCC7418_1205 [Halothece sp. PCC 7418]
MIFKLFKPVIFIFIIFFSVFFFNPTVSLATTTVEMASIFSFSGEQPKNLGVNKGSLSPCPQTPNCVSSQSKDVTHKVEPLTYNSSRKEALNKLKTMIEETDHAKIIEATSNYLYAQYTSRIMGFVDDVEFYLDPQENVIHVRSASRVGESDLGVNRRRIESIREQFQA